MAIIIHYMPEHNVFWAEASKADKDVLKGAGFNWCNRSYDERWCPPKASGINQGWWTSKPANAYKLKNYLDPAAAQAVNEWIESGKAEAEIAEAEIPISVHYIPETKVFFADAGKKFAKILKEAGFRWHDIAWSEHNISKCRACALKAPDKHWYTDNIDAAVRLIEFADAGAKVELDRYMLIVDQSRAIDYDIDIPLPKGKKPFKYQKAGIAWALSRENSLVADEMGVGKTLTSLAVINVDKSIKTVIVICLASLRINWQKECEMWLTQPHKITIVKHVDDIPKRKASDDETVSILIIGFPSVRGDYGKELYNKLMTLFYDLLIIDEAHNLKNPKALQTRNILGWSDLKEPYEEHKGIAHGARKKIYLTGTPIKNRPIEGWTIFHSLAPEIFDNYIKYAFRYCDAYWEEIWNGKETVKTLNVKGSSNSDELQRKLRSSIMIRRLKEDVLTELPPKTRQLIVLEPDDEVIELIKEEREKAGSLIDKLDSLKEDDGDEKYRQISASLEEQKARFEEISRVRHQLALAKIDAAYEHVSSMLEGMEEGKDKIILFAHHRDIVETMQKKFAEYNPVILYGGMSDDQKNKAVEAFQNDPKVKLFIGSISAAGTGLTLTASNTVIFCELDWSPSQILQAEDRAHRIGQKDNVLVQHLVFDGSLDAKIVKTFLNKMDVISKILDVGAEVKKITVQDIPKIEPIPSPGELKPIPIPVIVKAEYKPGQPTEQGGVTIKPGSDKPIKLEQSPTKPTIVEYTYTDEQKKAALEGLQILAEVCDYAQTKDMMGFNKTYTKTGHALASRDELTDKDMSGDYGAVHILNVHRRQMPTWIRDILGLWPNKEKAIYTPKQRQVMYMVAQLLNESPDKEQIFDESELQLIKQIAETDTSEKGEKTFSDKLLFVFRNILSEHWTEINPDATAILEHVGIKKAKVRGKRGETSIEPTIEGEDQLADEKISEEPEEIKKEETPSSESPQKEKQELVFLAKSIDEKYRIEAFKNILSSDHKITFISDNETTELLANYVNKDTAINIIKNKILSDYVNNETKYNIEIDQINVGTVKLTVPSRSSKSEKEDPDLLFHIRTDDGSFEMKIWKGKVEGQLRYYFKQLEKEFEHLFGNQNIENVKTSNRLYVEAAREKGIDYKILVDKLGIMTPVEAKPQLMFIAATRGDKYRIEAYLDTDGEWYKIKHFTGNKQVGSTGIEKDKIHEYLINHIANAARIDEINYIIKLDNIHIDQKEIKKLIDQPIKPIVFPEPEPPKVVAPPEPKPAPEPKPTIKYTEPQKGGIYSIIVYFTTLPSSTLKKTFSDTERKVFDKISDNLGEGKSWEVLNDDQINELRHLIDRHVALIPKEYLNYLTATGIKVGPQPKQPDSSGFMITGQRYTTDQKEIAQMSIVMLKQNFDNMPKKEKSQYTNEWISNINKLADLPQPISDAQVDLIINVIKKHRRLFEEMGVFEKLGVKFVGRPPKK